MQAFQELPKPVKKLIKIQILEYHRTKTAAKLAQLQKEQQYTEENLKNKNLTFHGFDAIKLQFLEQTTAKQAEKLDRIKTELTKTREELTYADTYVVDRINFLIDIEKAKLSENNEEKTFLQSLLTIPEDVEGSPRDFLTLLELIQIYEFKLNETTTKTPQKKDDIEDLAQIIQSLRKLLKMMTETGKPCR